MFLLTLVALGQDSFGQYSKAIELRCEYLSNPIGIDVKQPRLSWMLSDKRSGAKQLAYQILVSTDSLQLVKGKGNIWQTSKINSDVNLLTYKGKPLQPFTKYYWKINTWDKDNVRSDDTEIASFESGMMDIKNWKGSWISDDGNINLKPAPYFRKTFSNSKKIKSARAYIAVAGLYELSVNGKKIGNHRLDPMYTRFDRRTLYVSHDVTSEITEGINVVGVLLGNGWYNTSQPLYGIFTKLRGEAVLHFVWICVLLIMMAHLKPL